MILAGALMFLWRAPERITIESRDCGSTVNSSYPRQLETPWDIKRLVLQ